MNVFVALMVVLASWIYTYVQIHQYKDIKYVYFCILSCTSIKMKKKKNNKVISSMPQISIACQLCMSAQSLSHV